MRANTRACIAGAAGSLISGIEQPSIYDFHQARYIRIHGRVSRRDIHLFDHDRKCYFSDHGSDNKFNLYDHGNQTHISLDINSNQFTGFEHNSENCYSGFANGSFVTLFDSAEAKYFTYSL